MIKQIITLTSLFFVSLTFYTCNICFARESKATEEIVNPVLPGDRPDPSVIKIGDTYWATATSNEWAPLFPVFKSDDLQNWELVTYVFPDGAPEWAARHFWAPELAYDEQQDRVYAYYTARDKESNRLSSAVASADKPEGPYFDHGPLVAQELGSIDAYEYRDLDGKLYMMWKEDGNSQGEPTPMWAQEINEERTRLLGEKHELFRNDQPWEMHLVEGISVFREGDYFYALYSAGSCCDVNCNYVTGVARSETLLGPWEKFRGNPTLSDNDHWRCPGHGSVVKKDGDYYYLYHAYSRKGGVFVGREAVLEKLVWNEEGWPVFENNAVYNRETAAWDRSEDFTAGMDPLWQWRVTQDISYSTGLDGLFLQASRENEDLGTLLVQPMTSPDYEISAKIDLKNTGEQAAGGLALVGAADNSFSAPVAATGISAGNNKIFIWQTVNRETEILAESDWNNSDELAWLKMEVSQGHLLTFSVKRGSQWEVLYKKLDASHLVPWGMGFRFGLVAKGPGYERVNFKQFDLINY